MRNHIKTLPLALTLLATITATPVLAGATLYWTAPGDDGMSGVATRYDLRRSMQLLTAPGFALADTVAGVPLPAPPGTTQSCDVALPVPGTRYYFAIKTVDDVGNWSAMSNVVSIDGSTTAADPMWPLALQLSSPWPNPARATMRFRIGAPATTSAFVDVFDAAGRRVRIVWQGILEAGWRDLEWDLRDDHGKTVARGVYFLRARFGTRVQVKHVIVSA